MTLLDVRNQIVSILCEKSMFESRDFDLIKTSKELEGKRQKLVNAALVQLVEIGLVKQIDSDLWILNHPINSSGQEIKISMSTCVGVADTINTFLAANNDDETPRADVLNLHEGHIVMLLEIIDTVISTDPEGSKDEE